MHELSICRRIMDIVLEHVAAHPCIRVKKVVLEIGQLVAVEQSALIQSFQLLTKGTIAENAKLEINDMAGQGVCESCGKTVHLSQYYDACSACGSYSLTVIQGEVLRVQSMEVE